MSSVKRYEVNGSSSFYEDEKGSFVDYEDYAALEAKCAALAAELKQSQIDAGCYKKGMEASNERLVQVVAENAGLKQAESNLVRNIINDLGDTEFQYARVQTPATDAYLAEVRAQGVDAAIEHLTKKFEGTGHIGVPVMALEWLAQEIRKGGAA